MLHPARSDVDLRQGQCNTDARKEIVAESGLGVEKLIEDLQAVAKTANLEIYEFDDALVKKLFVELARRFRATAHRFGIEFEISVEGELVE